MHRAVLPGLSAWFLRVILKSVLMTGVIWLGTVLAFGRHYL